MNIPQEMPLHSILNKRNGKTVFVGWNADDVRQMEPAMRAAMLADHGQ